MFPQETHPWHGTSHLFSFPPQSWAGVASGQPSQTENSRLEGTGKVSHNGAGCAWTPNRHPGGGFQPSPRDVEGPRMHLTQSRPTRGLQGRPLPKAMVAVTMMRHTIPALQGMAESGGDWRHLLTSRGPDHPDPKAVKPPQGSLNLLIRTH